MTDKIVKLGDVRPGQTFWYTDGEGGRATKHVKANDRSGYLREAGIYTEASVVVEAGLNMILTGVGDIHRNTTSRKVIVEDEATEGPLVEAAWKAIYQTSPARRLVKDIPIGEKFEFDGIEFYRVNASPAQLKHPEHFTAINVKAATLTHFSGCGWEDAQ